MMMMAAIALGVAGAAPTTAEFTVGGERFRVKIPAGFCLPGPDQEVAMAKIAASDPANVTDVAFIECGRRTDELPELLAIKTLRMFETTPLKRDTFVPQMAAALPALDTLETQRKLLDQSEGNISGATGTKVDLSGSVRGRGRDDVCAYVGGTIDVSVADRKVTGLVGACATVVGDRQFSVYRVSYKPLADGGAGLLAEARATALAITPLPGK